ncbi:hypothetical protein [Pedobacter nutrimenti]|uniref:hypothetical protein n=1 Tax=Pedobacter nutrimenti TaxID=1241337 RepID=UPI00293174CC|nr:hypothetical protein [Pedobacter nutrimenti]
MFRSLIVFSLIFVMLGANFSRLFIYAGFELNRNYIASKLCENRDKPQLHCNGKCYLMKKLKQAEEKEKSQNRESQKNHFQEALITQKTNFNFQVQLLKVLYTEELPFVLPRHSTAIFHPPQA